MTKIGRRGFLAGTAATVALAGTSVGSTRSANEKLIVGLMGANDRGSQLARRIEAGHPEIEIAYVCDPDERAIAKGIAAATGDRRRKPSGKRDFREALDDRSVDALICAAPNHWHAPATVIACEAGKHVYVEKPCSHAAAEGDMMISAARRNQRIVQVGMQRRSGSLYQRAVERVREGALGEARYAKSWYYRNRPSIGHREPTDPPNWLDYNLWQGPAPSQPYRENILHYNWHFFWHWGDGELGNNGVHTIDICRWALSVDLPDRVTATGGRLRYDDDQETPDTTLAHFVCGDKSIIWEAVSWSPALDPNDGVGMEIRGDIGTMRLNDKGYTIYDNKRRIVEEFQGTRGDDEHLQNFVDAIRDGTRPNADLDEAHKSAMFCHLGNISYRLNAPLDVDPVTGRVKDNDAARKLWAIDYRDGWLPSA